MSAEFCRSWHGACQASRLETISRGDADTRAWPKVATAEVGGLQVWAILYRAMSDSPPESIEFVIQSSHVWLSLSVKTL